MVPVELLIPAINSLPNWGQSKRATHVFTVNWRKGYQIKMVWRGNASFNCYLDFGENRNAREHVLKEAFGKHAPAGIEPHRITLMRGYWDSYEFETTEIVTVNEIADIATQLGYAFTVLYVQTCVSSRPLFAELGIALVPGEMGKEWKDGAFIGYSTPDGQNL